MLVQFIRNQRSFCVCFGLPRSRLFGSLYLYVVQVRPGLLFVLIDIWMVILRTLPMSSDHSSQHSLTHPDILPQRFQQTLLHQLYKFHEQRWAPEPSLFNPVKLGRKYRRFLEKMSNVKSPRDLVTN